MRKLSLIISQVHYKVTTETKDYRGPQIVHGTNRIILYSEHQCTLSRLCCCDNIGANEHSKISPTISRLKSVRLFACNESGITDQLSASVLYYSSATFGAPHNNLAQIIHQFLSCFWQSADRSPSTCFTSEYVSL